MTLSVVVVCALGAVAYWRFGSAPGAGSVDGSHNAEDLEHASVNTVGGGARGSNAGAQRPAAEVLRSGDVAAASQQARESAERGVETGDLDALRKLRTALDARPQDKLLSNEDDDALDLAIACLAEDPEAKEDAQEFFRDEPATSLHMQVKRVCLGQP